jgi:hypothetical protein
MPSQNSQSAASHGRLCLTGGDGTGPGSVVVLRQLHIGGVDQTLGDEPGTDSVVGCFHGSSPLKLKHTDTNRRTTVLVALEFEDD